MLTGDPFEPHWLMMSGELCRDRLVMQFSPASVRTPDKMPCSHNANSIAAPEMQRLQIRCPAAFERIRCSACWGHMRQTHTDSFVSSVSSAPMPGDNFRMPLACS